jgi:hypothetical protein
VFSREIRAAAFPQRFRQPTTIVKYNGETDPRVWLNDYRLACQLGGATSDEVIIRNLPLHVTPVFPKETRCKPICMPGSSFMHIVTYKCIQKQYHIRKREIIRVLRYILETETPNTTSNRLGVAYAKNQQHLHKTSE